MNEMATDAVIISERPRKRTRAEIMRDKVKIRLARDETGPAIAAILKDNKIELPETDWSKVFPAWLIATVDDEVIGCIMVLPAKPFGFLEFLFVKPSVSFKLRAIAIRKLCMQGAATLTLFGCSYIFGSVEKTNSKFSDILKKNGMVKAAEADLMVKRLKPYSEVRQ